MSRFFVARQARFAIEPTYGPIGDAEGCDKNEQRRRE